MYRLEEDTLPDVCLKNGHQSGDYWSIGQYSWFKDMFCSFKCLKVLDFWCRAVYRRRYWVQLHSWPLKAAEKRWQFWYLTGLSEQFNVSLQGSHFSTLCLTFEGNTSLAAVTLSTLQIRPLMIMSFIKDLLLFLHFNLAEASPGINQTIPPVANYGSLKGSKLKLRVTMLVYKRE